MKSFLFLSLLALVIPSALNAQDRVEIRLLDTVQVHERAVTLDRLAVITGATPQQKAALGRLDVLQLDPEKTAAIVSRDFLQLRLLLSGFDEGSFRLSGPSEVHVTHGPGQPWTEKRLIEFLTRTIAIRMNVPPENLQVELAAPVVSTLDDSLRNSCDLRFDPVLPARISPGNLSLSLKIWQGAQLVGARIAQLKISQKIEVAVATRPIGRLEDLKAGDLRLEDRFVTQGTEGTSLRDWVGKRPVRDLNPGDVVGPGMLINSIQRPDRQLIRPRDIVQVVARSGPVRVTLQTAEALQGGDVGDTIRVRNETTNSILGGVIGEDGRVEIILK